jgi:gliding motility-associated protein GldM
MGGGGTPRQQMVGMMYLVLLAMLAMNASKSLLNAFVMLENGINKTVNNFANANAAFYTTIEKAAASSPAYQIKLDDALELKKKADEVVALIADDKIKLTSGLILTGIADTVNGGLKPFLDDGGIPLNKDNQDLGAQYYVPGGAPSPFGTALTNAVDEFRDLVIKTIDNDGDSDNDYLLARYKKLLDTSIKPDPNDPSVKTTFASRISEHLPLASVTANLTLYQSYIRNAEADVVGHIASKMDGEGMVVDKSIGLVNFDNGYVLKSDSVSADIYLAAYNSKSSSEIIIGEVDTVKFGGKMQMTVAPGQVAKPPMLSVSKTLKSNNGAATWSTLADETGVHFVTGVIKNVSSKGTFFTRFKSSYMVAEPSATVAATKMSVFYVGVPNPVSVSAPGVSVADIEVSAPGLAFKDDKKGGSYIVRPTKATNKKGVDVVVKNKKTGAILGKSNFRVKRLPDPAASVLGSKEGLISKGKLRAISKVDAKMENFDFDLSVKVQQFTLTVKLGTDLMSFKSKGNKLTPAMKKVLTKVGRGSRIYFEEIKVQMPGGARKVPSLIFKVK